MWLAKCLSLKDCKKTTNFAQVCVYSAVCGWETKKNQTVQNVNLLKR